MVKNILPLLLLLFWVSLSFSQTTVKSVNIGISRVTGYEYKYWELGPSIGAQLFYPQGSAFMFGGRIAANRWSSDKDELTGKYQGNTEGRTIDSYGLVFEFTPGFRYHLIQISEKINFFSQMGFGLYNINFETSKIFENNLGLNLGMIVVFYIHPLIQPEISLLFHTIFRGKNSLSYLSLNTGIIF